MEHLNHVIKGISSKNLIPILNCIKFDLNEKGLYMYDSNDNIIQHNKIEWNNVGIELDTNVYNIIQGNIFDRNTTYGIESKNGSLCRPTPILWYHDTL